MTDRQRIAALERELEKLRRQLPAGGRQALLVPQRPALFSGTCSSTSGVAVELVVRGGGGADCVLWLVRFGPRPTSGSVTITDGTDSDTIAYNSSLAAVQAALEGFASIGAGNVTVAGGGAFNVAAACIMQVTFGGDLADTDVGKLAISGAFTSTSTTWKRGDYCRVSINTGPALGSSTGANGSSGLNAIVYNDLGDVPTGRKCIVGWMGTRYELVNADGCP